LFLLLLLPRPRRACVLFIYPVNASYNLSPMNIKGLSLSLSGIEATCYLFLGLAVSASGEKVERGVVPHPEKYE
jgi:hypothetical protein